MATIIIDGTEYEIDTLSEETKAQISSLQFVDAELARLRARAAALQTARNAYGRALKHVLENGKAPEQDEVSIEGLGETIRFDE
jgi:Arc/MetJ family transcription regulator